MTHVPICDFRAQMARLSILRGGMVKRSWRIPAAVAALLVVAALERPAAAQSSNPLPPTAAEPGRYPYTKADVDFMTGMIAHHSQAIVMARWAPTHGASSGVRTLCARIINAQQDEITLMQQWLRQRGQPVPTVDTGAMAMMPMPAGMMMPGMLTVDQLHALDAARGDAFDKLFLKGMIQHHSGAIDMVTQLFNTPGAGQDETAFKLASDINVDQTTEIERMRTMLLTLELR